MNYMVTWHERPMGSALEYEAAQKCIPGVFRHWQPPASLRIEQFLFRVGEYDG